MPLLGLTISELPSTTSPVEGDDDDDEDYDEEATPAALQLSSTSADSVATPAEVLGLPSDFTAEERDKYDLKILAEYEVRIRIGQAFDQLEVVRQSFVSIHVSVRIRILGKVAETSLSS